MLKGVNNLVKDIQKFLSKLHKMSNKNKLFLVVLIVVSSIVLHYVYNKIGIDVIGKLRLLNPMRLMENMDNPEKKCVLFKMNGCPHCDALEPKWKEAKEKNDTNIKMSEVEQSEDGAKEQIDALGIKGFPTIKYFDGDKSETYDGGRTVNDILSFLKSKLSSSN